MLKSLRSFCNRNNLYGRLMFIFYYVLLGTQLYVVYYTEEDIKSKDSTYLYYFKLLAYIFVTLGTISHLQASFTQPGVINHSNNIQMIDFYTTTRMIAIKRAEIFNKAARGIMRPPDFENESDEEESDIEDDDRTYSESILLPEDKVSKLNSQFGYEFSICKKCKVCRMPGAHHCSSCGGCVYQMDHHCPWLNNCVGQFNQKYFIQFLIYNVLSIICSGIISLYYLAYRNPKLSINF